MSTSFLFFNFLRPILGFTLLFLLMFLVSVSMAHNNVVVIPLLDDGKPPVFASLKTDEAPSTDYFIHSETVIDHITGLEWQRHESEFSHNWEGANSYCEDLVLRGFNDWRLPNIKELNGITSYNRLSPALSVQAFPNPKASLRYWSSSQYLINTHIIRAANVSTGEVLNLSAPFSQGFVRCVRAGNSNGSTFLDNNDGTVLDLSFGLMWEKETFSEPQLVESLSLAQEYCFGLALGGFNDWRMPSVKELVSLLELRSLPAINSAFIYRANLSSSAFLFSGTVYVAGTPPDGVWSVRFRASPGSLGSSGATVVLRPLENNTGGGVKCVRNVN